MDGSPSIFDDLIAWGACRVGVLQSHYFTAWAGSRLCMTHLQWQLMHGDDGFYSVLNCMESTELNALVLYGWKWSVDWCAQRQWRCCPRHNWAPPQSCAFAVSGCCFGVVHGHLASRPNAPGLRLSGTLVHERTVTQR